MEFEISQENRQRGTILLTKFERKLLNSALFNVLHVAATANVRIEVGTPIESLSKLLLPEYYNAHRIRGVSPAQLNAIRIAVIEDNKNIAYDKAREVGGFIRELSVASRVLRGEASLQTPLTATEIDTFIEHIEIPDNLDGIV